jgi:hypothetical protein
MRRRRKLSILAGIGVALVATTAWAFFASSGTGVAAATVGALAPPTNVTVPLSVSGSTVPVSWTAPTPPGTGALGYYVQRFAGTTPSNACGTTLTTRITTTSCNDLNVTTGAYTYKVTGYWRTWTAQSASNGSVNVQNDTTAPTVSSINTTDPNPTSATSLHWLVTFSESVNNVGIGNFGLVTSGTGGTAPSISSVSPSTGPSTTWTVTVNTNGTTGADNGSIRLNLTNAGTIQDQAANGLTGAPVTGQAYNYDSTAPTVAVTTVNGNAVSFPFVTNHDVTSIGGTCSTGSTDVATVNWFVTGGAVSDVNESGSALCVAGGTWTVTLPTARTSESTHTVSATQADTVGNIGSSGNQQVTIDKTPPAPTVTTPANNGFANTLTPTFSGAAGNTTGDSTTITVNVYSGAGTTTLLRTFTTTRTGTTWSGNYPTGSPALVNLNQYTVQVTQVDAAANVGTGNANTFTVLATGPAPTVTAPANNGFANTLTPTLSGAAGNAIGNSTTITVRVYSGAGTKSLFRTFTTTRTGAAWTTTYPSGTPILVNGSQYTVQVTQVDIAGNVGTSNANTFTVDTVGPTGGSISYTNGYFTTASVPVIFSAGTDAGSDINTTTAALQRSSATLSTNSCGGFGSFSTIATAPTSVYTDSTVASGNCYSYQYVVSDNAGNSTTYTSASIAKVDTSAPTTPTLAFSGLSTNAYYSSGQNALYFRPAAGGTYTVIGSSIDAQSAIQSGTAGYTFSSLTGNNFAGAQTSGQNSYTFGSSATQPGSTPTLFSTNNANLNSPDANYNLISDTTPPSLGAVTVNETSATGGGSSSTTSSTSFTISGRIDYAETQSATASGLVSSTLTIQSATLSGSTCGAPGSGGPYTSPSTISGTTSPAITAGFCYLYTLTGKDNVGNSVSISTTVKVTIPAPAGFDIQSNPSPQNGKVEGNDQIVYTFSQVMDPNTIKSGFTGASTAITANVVHCDTNASPDCLDVTSTNLGRVALQGTYVHTGNHPYPLSGTMSMSTVGGRSVVTIALSGTHASAITDIRSFNMVWTPSAAAKNTGGTASDTTAVTQSGAAKENF